LHQLGIEGSPGRHGSAARCTVHAILKEISGSGEITIIGEFDEPEWVVEPG